jgi:broad specificity phosphatase PhoE
VRHRQAGTRQSYDALSDLGRRQARLLGEYFMRHRIRFDAAYSGGLVRQQGTVDEVRAACDEFPVPVVDPGWNEFDLDHVYRELAPVLCEEDANFRREFEAMK